MKYLNDYKNSNNKNMFIQTLMNKYKLPKSTAIRRWYDYYKLPKSDYKINLDELNIDESMKQITAFKLLQLKDLIKFKKIVSQQELLRYGYNYEEMMWIKQNKEEILKEIK